MKKIETEILKPYDGKEIELKTIVNICDCCSKEIDSGQECCLCECDICEDCSASEQVEMAGFYGYDERFYCDLCYYFRYSKYGKVLDGLKENYEKDAESIFKKIVEQSKKMRAGVLRFEAEKDLPDNPKS